MSGAVAIVANSALWFLQFSMRFPPVPPGYNQAALILVKASS